jgi:hypothetical protein
MGYFIKFKCTIPFKRENLKRAVEIANHMHSDEMVSKHAAGGCWPPMDGPIQRSRWYSFVTHATTYLIVPDIFNNWHFRNGPSAYRNLNDTSSDVYIYEGSYDSKIGQVDFLLEQLAEVIEDTTIVVKGEDGAIFHWIIKDHKFESVKIKDRTTKHEEDD